jgi:hypothetical protein
MTKEEITYQCTRDVIQALMEEKVNSFIDEINADDFKERVINKLYEECHIEEEHDFTIEEALEGFVPLFNSAKSSFKFHLTNVYISKIRIK